MNRWAHKLQLGDVFRNEGMAFEQQRDAIVGRIKRARFYSEDDHELAEIVAELTDVENVDEFDWVWDRFYDWADANRVWVDTFKVA